MPTGEAAKTDSSLTLATTTIEDLLLNHRLTEVDHDQYDVVTLAIPEYQRPYKWTEKNALQLLDDIIDAKDANRERYRVGTLILHRRTGSGEATFDIVDGQQRVVTFALLLKAFGESTYFMDQPLSDNPDTARNVYNNYNALQRRADAFVDAGEKKKLVEYILHNCEFIVVITGNLPEAFQFFDSQNARGKKLYPHDLLKAYHLRELRDLDEREVEAVVRGWEDLDQSKLSSLFADYLYCIKCWVRDNPAYRFTEHDIQMFKGVSQQNSYPYAQFFKGAYSFASMVNSSPVPFVTGMQALRPFQLDAPIIAGHPFFEYTQHYFDILHDIQDNNKYEGYFVNDNAIVKTLDAYYDKGVGNRVTRRLFDTALLLYVDRFCPSHPTKSDLEMFEEFIKLAFVWAYSLRAQYVNLGWYQAQNYVMGKTDKKNSFNIYKEIVECDSPRVLLSALSERMKQLRFPGDIREGLKSRKQRSASGSDIDLDNGCNVYLDYLHFFKTFNFLEGVK